MTDTSALSLCAADLHLLNTSLTTNISKVIQLCRCASAQGRITPHVTCNCSTEKLTKWQRGYGGTKTPLSWTESIFHKQKNFTQSLLPLRKAEAPHKQKDLCSRKVCSCYWLVMLIKNQNFSSPAPQFTYSGSNFTVNLSCSKLLLLDRKQRHSIFDCSGGLAWWNSDHVGTGSTTRDGVLRKMRPPTSVALQDYINPSPPWL